MPIVFVHGVAVRDHSAFLGVKPFLAQYVAPAMISDPSHADRVQIIEAYWGDCGATFAWNRASLPSAQQAGAAAMGASAQSTALVAAQLTGTPDLATTTAPAPNVKSNGEGSAGVAAEGLRSTAATSPAVDTVSASELSRLLSAVVATDTTKNDAVAAAGPSTTGAELAASPTADEQAAVASAFDTAAHDVLGDTKVPPTPELVDKVTARAQIIYAGRRPAPDVASQGVMDNVFNGVAAMAKQLLMKAEGTAASNVSELILRYRTAINTMVTNFDGDVFVYQTDRGDTSAPPPGQIVRRVLDALEKAKSAALVEPSEPLVVLTHSMGGQLMYDTVTYYLPKIARYQQIRVDFWAAAASQVGLFEEMKLFKVSDKVAYNAAKGNKAPFPSRSYLGYWWNVWDPNDILSYTAGPIFDDVDDESFESGLPPLHAHGGYLVSADFFRRFAAKVKAYCAREKSQTSDSKS